MMTSLACLTLEVYYRYLPLYKLDKPEEIKPAGPAEGNAKAEGAREGARCLEVEATACRQMRDDFVMGYSSDADDSIGGVFS